MHCTAVDANCEIMRPGMDYMRRQEKLDKGDDTLMTGNHVL